jgi:hypothetical protein
MSRSPGPTIPAGDPLAVQVTDAIRGGDVAQLRRLLDGNPELARAQIADPRCDDTRSLLHIATDWPGHFPNVAAIVRALAAAGAGLDARGGGRITEAPLHWAASSDDVAALDALLDAELLLDRGAELDWVAPWDGLTPLDAAVRGDAAELAEWPRLQGARRAAESA